MRESMDRIMLGLLVLGLIGLVYVVISGCAAHEANPWPERDCSGLFCGEWVNMREGER